MVNESYGYINGYLLINGLIFVFVKFVVNLN